MESAIPELRKRLPNTITPERFISLVVQSVRDVPKLLQTKPDTLFKAVNDAARFGFEIGGPLAEASIVPYGEVAQLIPGYRGYLKLAWLGGFLRGVSFGEVREGDEFQNVMGSHAAIHHVPSEAKDRLERRITHVYVIFTLKDGASVNLAWTAEAIDAHKEKFAKAWNAKDSAWQNHWSAMAYKTLVKQVLSKGMVPLSPVAQQFVMTAPDDIESVHGAMSPASADESDGALMLEGTASDHEETGHEAQQ